MSSTGKQSEHEVPHYKFKGGCHWSELPGGSLLITGGGEPAVRDVVKIDTLREYAGSSRPPMRTARRSHATVYHSQYVYVLGGFNGSGCLRSCERYLCAESRWKELPALPIGGYNMTGVEVENSVYALGGDLRGSESLDTVQKLSLDSLTWQLMELKLPQAAFNLPCFKKDTEVLLVINKTLYSFPLLQLKAVKTLDGCFICSLSYYSRGTLYYELWNDHSISSYKL
jgi:hypothetical protein